MANHSLQFIVQLLQYLLYKKHIHQQNSNSHRIGKNCEKLFLKVRKLSFFFVCSVEIVLFITLYYKCINKYLRLFLTWLLNKIICCYCITAYVVDIVVRNIVAIVVIIIIIEDHTLILRTLPT